MRVDYEVITNLRKPNSRTLGPLTTDELEQQYVFWEKRVQQSCGRKTKAPTQFTREPPRYPGVQGTHSRSLSSLSVKQAHLCDQAGGRCPSMHPS